MTHWRRIWLLLGWLLLVLRPVGEEVAATNLTGLTVGQLRIMEGVPRNRGSGIWTDLSSNQLVELRNKAEKTDDAIRRSHLPGGLVASLRYADTNRTDLVAYENLELSGAYTGFYLTASTFRYAVYREASALANIRAALDGIELLLRSSGRLGYLPRFAGLKADPAYQAFYSEWGGADDTRPGLGKWAYPGGPDAKAYVWLGKPSREVYSGVNLGLATIFQFVREPKIRERLTNIVDLMVSRLEADHWRLDDGQGNVDFMPPLQAAALLRTAASLNKAKYNTLYQARLADLLASHGGEPLAQPGLCLYCDYTDSVFLLADYMVLCRLEEESSPGKLFFQERLTQIYRRSHFHLNPWLAAAYISILEKALGDLSSKASLQGMLYQFPIPRWARAGMRDTNWVADSIEANGNTWARTPLQLEQRRVQAFQWTQSPVYLPAGEDAPVVHPGIDFILPFWIARDGNLIPDAESLATPTKVKTPLTNTNRFRPSATNSTIGRSLGTNTPSFKK